jgi:hypothetical protein
MYRACRNSAPVIPPRRTERQCWQALTSGPKPPRQRCACPASNWRRAEYLDTSGSASDGTPNLLYGPGSAAWSLTLTPTYQYKRFFARAEIAYVGARHITPGLAFGSNGRKGSQVRGLFEAGLLF